MQARKTKREADAAQSAATAAMKAAAAREARLHDDSEAAAAARAAGEAARDELQARGTIHSDHCSVRQPSLLLDHQ